MKVTGLIPANGAPHKCDVCPTLVIWAVTPNGGRIRVDAQLSLEGNLVLWFEVDGLGQPVGDPPVQRVMIAPASYQGPRWIHHWATCSKATPWRRTQAARGAL